MVIDTTTPRSRREVDQYTDGSAMDSSESGAPVGIPCTAERHCELAEIANGNSATPDIRVRLADIRGRASRRIAVHALGRTNPPRTSIPGWNGMAGGYSRYREPTLYWTNVYAASPAGEIARTGPSRWSPEPSQPATTLHGATARGETASSPIVRFESVSEDG
jgi:hypothetical protein